MSLIGKLAPLFNLPDLTGQEHALEAYRGRVMVLDFWSAECTWSERTDLELNAYFHEWGEKVALLRIASNASEPPELLARVASERNLGVILRDSDQSVADLYGAQMTPHLFVVDAGGILRYQGAFDDVTFRQRAPTRHYLHQAVEAVKSGMEPDPAETPPYGCVLVRYGDTETG